MTVDAAQTKALHEPTQSNLLPLFINLAAFLGGIASLATGWPSDHWAWVVFAIIWLSYFQHTWMTIFHEDVHYSLYRRRWHNVRSGIIVGTILMVPFSVYRQMHLGHHKRMNQPDDAELWPYCDPTKSLTFRRVFVFFDLLLGYLTGVFIYNRVFFLKDSPIKDPALRRRIWLEYLLIVVFWGTIWTWVAVTDSWWLFAKVYLIPAFVTGFFQAVRKLTEHLGLPLGHPMKGARTVIAKGELGKAVAYTSFDISKHGLHHQFPAMPHYNLKTAFSLDEDKLADAPIFSSHFAAILDMFRCLTNPGIGVNAVGAAQPATADGG